jgi:hypothetical protein
MITEAKEDEIRALLALGTLHHREIARRAHVSPGTVKSVAEGKRPIRRQRGPKRERKKFHKPRGDSHRCRTCGGQVFGGSCVLCQTYAQPADSTQSEWSFAPPPEGPCLDGVERERYEEIRAKKIERLKQRKSRSRPPEATARRSKVPGESINQDKSRRKPHMHWKQWVEYGLDGTEAVPELDAEREILTSSGYGEVA